MIYPAKRVKGAYYINGIAMNLKDYRAGKRNCLTPSEVKEFDEYIENNNLELK